MRLIDADALYESLMTAETGKEYNFCYPCREIIQAIEKQPTVAQRWIPVTERLPKENVYVLVWCGEVKIARIIRGISKEQRVKMQEGTIDDPVSYGWNLSNGYFEIKRSESYRTCDENGNNKVPYCWDCIYGEMFGQDVKAWMPLPEPYKEGEQKQPEPLRINLNEPIKVKLTDRGKEIYYHQYDRTNQIAGREICKPSFPKEDENGYTEFQLWRFIELYGTHIGMTLPNVIEPLEIVYAK